MSESTASHNAGISTGRRTSLVQVGGALGIAGCLIGLAIFLTACAGFEAAFSLSIIPMALSVPGLILTVVGGFVQKDIQIEDTAALSAMFVNIAGIIGALIEIGVWRGWPLIWH